MSDYTPTTEEVREAYLDRKDFEDAVSFIERRGDEVAAAEFERWLASVKAEAWDEGYDEPRECCGLCPTNTCPWDNGQDGPTNPYRKEANDECD